MVRNRGERRPRNTDDVAEDEGSPRSLSPQRQADRMAQRQADRIAQRQEQKARNVLLYQLSRSAKTAKQCRDILEKREIDTEIAESVIQRYIEVGLIDDASVAGVIVNSRRKYKGLAKSAIKRELSEKGIEDSLIEQAVAELDPEAELAAATELAEKRISRLAGLEPAVRNRRLMGYLARKGYTSAQIIPAIKVAEQQLSQTPGL